MAFGIINQALSSDLNQVVLEYGAAFKRPIRHLRDAKDVGNKATFDRLRNPNFVFEWNLGYIRIQKHGLIRIYRLCASPLVARDDL